MERALARRGIHFRATEPDAVAHAYAAMSVAEFDAVNGRQDWANWRTIPRCLSGHVPDRPLRVLDLGSGTGSSTRVLAHYCPAGSHITGLEFVARLIDIARQRTYSHRSGVPAHVDFHCQGVTEPLHQADGSPVPDHSVDVVNASGIVGHHLRPTTIKPLIEELCRMLRAEGIAMLDVGPTLEADALKPIMAAAGYSFLGHYRSWFADPTGQCVFRK